MNKRFENFKKAFISGSFREDKKHFDEVEIYLKGQGLEVVRMDKFWDKQTEIDTTNFEKIDYWLVDLEHLATCDMAVFISGWDKHAGCRLERKFAELSDTITIVEYNAHK